MLTISLLVLRFQNKFIVYWKIRDRLVDQKSVYVNILRNRSTSFDLAVNFHYL